MKMRKQNIRNLFRGLALAVAGVSVGVGAAVAASYEWQLDGNLSSSLGSGTMAYADATSSSSTTFGTTGGGVPNIGGQVATYMHVPAFTSVGNGYNLTLSSTGPNGGGGYVNQYTIIFDVLSTGPLNWTPFFNTEPANGNDADFYLAYDGSVGIGSLYSSAGLIAPNTWNRIAFVANLSSSTISYYVNGSLVASGSQSGSGLDGRWSLYSNLDPGHDLRLFNEPTGLYTHDLYVNTVAFVDSAMTGPQLSALGGPNAYGIFVVPEPSTMSLAVLGLLAGALCKKVGRRG